MNERFTELWAMVQQDRKKAATLCVLMLVAVVMGIRAVVTGAGGPSKASAAPAAKGGVGKSAGAAAKPMTLEESLASLRPQRRIAPEDLGPRDLFRSQWAVIGAAAGEGEGKSGAGDADNAAEGAREDPRARVEAEASKLRLRSTLLGGNPLAVIEGAEGAAARRRVARVGEEIDGFRLIRIEAHEIEVEKEGIRVVIEQSRPTP